MGKQQRGIIPSGESPAPRGDAGRHSICKACGKLFEQRWDKSHRRYTDWTVCEDCRALARKEELSFTLHYEPHEYQRRVHESDARFKVLAWGIRGGKDYCCVTELVTYLIRCGNEDARPGTLVPRVLGWVIAPTLTVARQNWRDLRRVIPRELVVSYSETTMSILLQNGILIEVHSAYDPESLVATGLDAVLITEAARVKDLEDVWSNLEGRVNSPYRGLEGKGGIALVNSSPLGKNYFYKMFCWGQKGHPDYDPQWESWQMATWQNPHMAGRGDEVQKNGRTYRENLERRMSKRRYQQDYLAMFLSDVDAVFPGYRQCFIAPATGLRGAEQEAFLEEWRSPAPYASYQLGYDPASINDAPILLVRECESGRVKRITDMSGMGWDAQFDTIAAYSRIYNGAPCAFGRTGHETVDSQLQKRGVVTIPLNEQGSNKANLVENLARVLENRQILFLDDGSEIIERTKFEFSDYIRVRKGNNFTFSNGTNDGHDDTVSAAYFAFYDCEVADPVLPSVGIMMGV